MPDNSTTTTTELTSQYTAQVTNDLESNLKEQDRVSAEIAALTEQLAALRHDHSVLLNVQQALGLTPAPAAPQAAAAATVPAPREKAATEPATGKGSKTDSANNAGNPVKRTRPRKSEAKKTEPKKADATQGSATAGKPAVKKPADNGTGTKDARPTLVELVRAHLGAHSEPRSAAEVTTALGEAHPERDIKTTVVRTTLEALVARYQAQRTKQGSSVFYSAPDAAGQTASPEAEAEPVG